MLQSTVLKVLHGSSFLYACKLQLLHAVMPDDRPIHVKLTISMVLLLADDDL
jgi:hypothetical protein